MSKRLIQPADIGGFFRGGAQGSVAKRLLAANMNIDALRPFADNPDPMRAANATLLYDEWKEIDRVVLEIAQQRRTGIDDLISRGLTYDLEGNGLATTVLQYQDASDLTEAAVHMQAQVHATKDRPEFGLGYLPLPIISKPFSYDIRVLSASRRGEMPLDTTTAAMATRKVMEMAEYLLFTGGSNLTFGGGTIYGYTDFPQRETVSLGGAFNTKTGDEILDKVREMKQASIDNRHYGPWVLYVPTADETALDDDFKAESDLTIRQRILQVSGIQDVKVADFLPAGNVLLVEMNSETVRLVVGQQPTPIEWDEGHGLVTNFLVMAILVPQLRADQDGRCGIVHAA